MKNTLAALAVALGAFVSTLPVSAQELTPGVWSGTITLPGNPQPMNVSYEVARVDGALAIAMTSILVQEVIRFRDVQLSEDQLTFWWEPGVPVDCTLQKTELGGFEGPCEPRGGGPAGALTMVPPA